MLIWICRLAPAIFFINSLILGAIQLEYSPRQDAISQLVHTPYGLWQTANFMLFGLLTLVYAYYLRERYSGNLKDVRYIQLATFVFGLSLVLLGLLPTDKPDVTTTVGQLHGAVFIVTVLTQAVLQFIVVKKILVSTKGIYLLFNGLITTFGLLGLITAPNNRGLIQRIFVGAIVVWVIGGTYWLESVGLKKSN